MGEWTRRDEGKPPVGTEVLAVVDIHGRPQYDIVYRLKKGGYWSREWDGLTDDQVTHWMKLAPLPDDVKGD